MQQRTPRFYKYKMSRSTIDSSPSKVTAKTAEHDMVMGALRSAQDVIEGILNATQALLTSLTYPDSSTVMGAGSSPAESEAKLLLLPTRSAEKLAKELASSAKERPILTPQLMPRLTMSPQDTWRQASFWPCALG